MLYGLVPSCAVLEVLVMAFQSLGVLSLVVTRLLPGTIAARRGRRIFILSLFGLGITGALCGREDSHFALFAGATLTALFIGMIVGGGSLERIAPIDKAIDRDTALAA